MKKLLLATSCLALSSAGVMAADLPMQTKSPIMAAPPAFSWTGCYVGAHVGGGTMTNTEGSQNGKGGLAGGQAGCNYQDGNWVFGVEGEGYWSGIKSTSNSSDTPSVLGGAVGIFGNTLSNKNDFSIAARAGITLDRTLIYGKGGWAWGSFSQTSFNQCCSIGSPLDSTTMRGTLDGFLVGAGIEHALTRNWTVKLEYNFIGFGGKEVSRTECLASVCAVVGTSTLSATKQVFKVGANYLFDFGGAPLVAKY
jgi:outer membrane immunogenic protein